MWRVLTFVLLSGSVLLAAVAAQRPSGGTSVHYRTVAVKSQVSLLEQPAYVAADQAALTALVIREK